MKYKLQLTSLYTLSRRELTRIIRIWPQTLLPPVITAALYLAIFGKMIGSKIGAMQGFEYIDYITPGLVMMSIISNSYTNVSSSFFGTKFQKNIEEMLVAPMSTQSIMLGFIIGGMARGLMVGGLVYLIANAFTDITLIHINYTLIVAILTSFLFATLGFLNGLFAKKFDDIAIIPMFILTPMIYLGGVFYSIDLLPAFWQKISLFNPILYMINGFRYGMLAEADMAIYYSIAMLSTFTVCFYLLALYLFNNSYGVRN